MIGNGRRVYGGNGEHDDGRQWKMDDNGNDGNGRRVFDGNGVMTMVDNGEWM